MRAEHDRDALANHRIRRGSALRVRDHRESDGSQFSNADNMAMVGVLSTQLLHERLVRAAPAAAAPLTFRTLVDRLEGSA